MLKINTKSACLALVMLPMLLSGCTPHPLQVTPKVVPPLPRPKPPAFLLTCPPELPWTQDSCRPATTSTNTP